ncbi:uncharacterized protein PRCAT00004254001 [Priceomyces carsonii]|uniref:uncharacterized protein n=1 Tax=Priceomyces carsonii TaxID=28549 RepID=UPI002ED9694E|nr:unnamed protein product [Priceomyces carsonii]
MTESPTEKKNTGRRRTTYSRKGCVVCKTRKLKCDETKPQCSNCVKARRICNYLEGAKFSKSRTISLEDVPSFKFYQKYKHNDKSLGLKSITPTKTEPSTDESTTAYITQHEVRDSDKRSEVSPNDSVMPLQNQDLLKTPASTPSLEGIFDPNREFDQMLMDDATSLALGLNDVAEFDMDQLNIENFPEIAFTSEYSRDIILEADTQTDIRIQQTMASHDLLNDHINYIRLFKKKYSLWLIPLCSESKNICAQTLLAQAVDFPFLLYAILSISARYESFLKEDKVDEHYLKLYFVKCCKELSRIFEDKHHMASYIEPLILTTLLLVTDAAVFINGDWRAHLKAAHNLFSKYVDAYKKNSPAIVLSRSWFAVYEILAVSTNTSGGAIASQNELDMLTDILFGSKDSKLGIELGLYLPNGYNVFLGYTDEAVLMFITFVKIAIKIRESQIKCVSPEDLSTLMNQIDVAKKTFLASDNCLIEKDNAFYPRNATGMLLPTATYGYIGEIVFSWFDISHKLHVQALYLKVLTDESFLNLPRESSLVQSLVKEILSYCHFFLGIKFTDPLFSLEAQLELNKRDTFWQDHRLINCHWALLTCGVCCLNHIDRLKIEIYFRSMIQMGARSFKTSFEHIQKKWNGEVGISECVPFC